MADVYEQNLASKSTLTTTDYIRVVGSDNVSYKQLVSDVAKKIIENYTGSTLAGSAQSVKSAVDSLNSKTMIRYIVAIPSITTGNSGYADIRSYYPGQQTGHAYLFATLYNYGITSPVAPVVVCGNSNYIMSAPNTTITNLEIAYIYAPLVEARP